MGRSLILSILACLAGLMLVAACSSNPPDYGQQAPQPVRDCDMQIPGYPGCEEAPYGAAAGDYYPNYGDAYYPGTGVIIVPVPVVVPAVPPPAPPAHRPPPPSPKHHRQPPERTCHPQPGHPCP